jgi:hypothetical protein
MQTLDTPLSDEAERRILAQTQLRSTEQTGSEKIAVPLVIDTPHAVSIFDLDRTLTMSLLGDYSRHQ